MTSLFEPVVGDSNTVVCKDANHNIRRRGHRHVLKSKKNTYKNKCKKNLKRKLKKYKLRQDGKEDPDIIDVSDSLVSSLFIRSPNKNKDTVELEIEELRPKNYLFRMVRRKHSSLNTFKGSHSTNNQIKTQKENADSPKSLSLEEKKQTNAFKLLMESRNKSLGTNSPGKNKPSDDTELHEIAEKRNIKAKRNLMLQKMAEEKGSLKKKVVEEQEDKYIKKKMEKRAEKLKSMILNKEPKTVTNKEKLPISQKVRSPLDSIDSEKNGKVSDKSLNTLQLVNMFNDVDNKIKSKKKIISKEDEEFLQKLSPSIKKKESMLCYFKKVEKDQDSPVMDIESSNENDSTVIKVKFTKLKKRGRKKKLSLKKVCEDKKNDQNIEEEQITIENKEHLYSPSVQHDQLIEIQCIDVTDNNIEIKEVKDQVKYSTTETNAERKKRKREARENLSRSKQIIDENPNEVRPKRTVKRPIKYNDEVALTSSDEELHIFTPKKKKHEGKNKSVPTVTDIIVIKDDKDLCKLEKKSCSNEKLSAKEKKLTKTLNPTKVVKLAPIFSKPQLDPAAIEAKQKFLQSGVPEQLKKLMAKQITFNTFNNSFPVVVHIQQLDASCAVTPANLLKEIHTEDFIMNKSQDIFTKMLDFSTTQTTFSVQTKISMNTQDILQNLKESYPRFPVYRIYKLLRGKKKGEYKNSDIFSNLDNSVEILNCSVDMQNDNPDQLPWSDKYKPLTGSEIIGNFDSIKELKKWLVTWTENEKKSKVNNSLDSDSSDYYQSEPDSRDSMKSCNNLLILSGPVGCGKTSCVYAVAAELCMKVIEVNASSRRTGKIMLQDLQEATQSHKVNRGTSSSENSQKSQDIFEPVPEVKKRGRPKKIVDTVKKIMKEKCDVNNALTSSQESTRTAMSLILIDDADIIFDQDDGFCSAIMQLVQCSKRPVILVTSSLTLPHLQKFLQSSKLLKMKPLLPKMLGTWLDLMCLADSGLCWPGLGAKVLNFCKGDMRRTVNCLQFYVGSMGQGLSGEANSQADSQNIDTKINVEDENSCMSWSGREGMEEKNIVCDTDPQSIEVTLFKNHTHLKYLKCPLNISDVWWSVPKLLKTESHDPQKSKCKESLESISIVLDSISACDYFNHQRPAMEYTMFSHPWSVAETNSVSELEDMHNYDGKHETTKNLCHEIVTSSISIAQENMGIENTYTLSCPGMSDKRQREQLIKRHKDLSSYLSPQSSLDRNTLALDYWSACRTICRTERSKTDSNSKRNNRFCHYLKSISFLCKTESFDDLANSLNPNTNF